jgi:hypothetical protein
VTPIGDDPRSLTVRSIVWLNEGSEDGLDNIVGWKIHVGGRKRSLDEKGYVRSTEDDD